LTLVALGMVRPGSYSLTAIDLMTEAEGRSHR